MEWVDGEHFRILRNAGAHEKKRTRTCLSHVSGDVVIEWTRKGGRPYMEKFENEGAAPSGGK
jgi:hypothetical protein